MKSYEFVTKSGVGVFAAPHCNTSWAHVWLWMRKCRDINFNFLSRQEPLIAPGQPKQVTSSSPEKEETPTFQQTDLWSSQIKSVSWPTHQRCENWCNTKFAIFQLSCCAWTLQCCQICIILCYTNTESSNSSFEACILLLSLWSTGSLNCYIIS